MSDERDKTAFERRAKQAFDDSVAGLDAATRSRLTQARYRALEERAAPWRWSLVPAGVLAATAVVAWFLVGQTPPPPTTMEASLQATPLTDLEILLGEEDLEMLDEELEFYGWLEEQPEFADVDDNVG